MKANDKEGLPGAEDFTPRAVYRAVLVDTLQHPLTILPAAASAVGVLYNVLLGLSPTAFLVSVGGALVAAGAWVFNYFVRGEDLARDHVRRLTERRHRARLGEVDSLAAEWETTGDAEGIQQARELGEAYRRLDELLEGRFEETGGKAAFTLQRLRVLADETYREGVAILRQALELRRALDQVDRAKLERELETWRAELAQVGEGGASDARRGSLEVRIAAHVRRLELFGEQERTLEELLARSETLESALETTYLGSVDLKSTDTFLTRGQAASELERAVEAARRVEDRLRHLGAPATEEDEIYLSAGESPGAVHR